jgi:hypothetical protein
MQGSNKPTNQKFPESRLLHVTLEYISVPGIIDSVQLKDIEGIFTGAMDYIYIHQTNHQHVAAHKH